MIERICDGAVVCGGIVVFQRPSFVGGGGEMHVRVFVGKVQIPRE